MRIYQSTFDVMRSMPPFIPRLRDANREGLKSQTRRVIALPKWSTNKWQDFELAEDGTPLTIDKNTGCLAQIHCHYGKPGHILYMREPLFKGPFDFAHYADSKTVVFDIMTGEPVKWMWKVNTLSQLYMPKVAARSFFQYEFIRVQQVQEITRADAKAEGVNNLWSWDAERNAAHPEHFRRALLNPYVANYSVLWDEINAKRGFGWDVNPWVWVLGYKLFDMKEISVINSNMEAHDETC
jgi:hypothetical protein